MFLSSEDSNSLAFTVVTRDGAVVKKLMETFPREEGNGGAWMFELHNRRMITADEPSCFTGVIMVRDKAVMKAAKVLSSISAFALSRTTPVADRKGWDFGYIIALEVGEKIEYVEDPMTPGIMSSIEYVLGNIFSEKGVDINFMYHCPGCGMNAQKNNASVNYEFQCPMCGKFVLTGTALAVLRSSRELIRKFRLEREIEKFLRENGSNNKVISASILRDNGIIPPYDGPYDDMIDDWRKLRQSQGKDLIEKG